MSAAPWCRAHLSRVRTVTDGVFLNADVIFLLRRCEIDLVMKLHLPVQIHGDGREMAGHFCRARHLLCRVRNLAECRGNSLFFRFDLLFGWS